MKYLGIDWGMKKIGLAISEGTLSSPFKTLHVSSLNQAIDQVVKIIKEEEINLVVIGKPEGEMGKKVEVVVKALIKKGANVVETDETLSTKQAKEDLIILGRSKKDRIDDNQQASAIILQQFLDYKDENI